MSEQKNIQDESFSSLYKKATKDVNSLGPLGRIFVAMLVIIALFKLTPILDLIYYAFQIVVIPTIFMVAWGVVSKETYEMTIGWIDNLINYLRDARDKAAEELKAAETARTETVPEAESAQN